MRQLQSARLCFTGRKGHLGQVHQWPPAFVNTPMPPAVMHCRRTEVCGNGSWSQARDGRHRRRATRSQVLCPYNPSSKLHDHTCTVNGIPGDAFIHDIHTVQCTMWARWRMDRSLTARADEMTRSSSRLARVRFDVPLAAYSLQHHACITSVLQYRRSEPARPHAPAASATHTGTALSPHRPSD